LHVRTAAVLHQSFLWLERAQAKFGIFRVPQGMLRLLSSQRRAVAAFAFAARPGFK